jgi:uncharacterized membrane protein YhaH (DUF805 family)
VLRTFPGVKGTITRRQYLLAGVGLMVFKYVVDATAIYLVAHVVWTPWSYLFPLIGTDRGRIGALPVWLQIALLIWTLPFIWIGVTLMMRRAVDAGRSPAWCAAFFIPVFNYAAMLWLGALPSAPVESSATTPRAADGDRFETAIFGVLGAAAFGLLAILISVVGFANYGFPLFVGTPFIQGMVCGWAFNRDRARSARETTVVVWISLLLVAGVVFLFAMEGVICLLMALPIAAVLGVMGGIIGRRIALRGGAGSVANAAALLFVVPVGAAINSVSAPAAPGYEVVTVVDVAAAPTVVWRKVVQFDEIKAPLAWYFRGGIAYPVRATIDGAGVGAIRRCEFSTGAFIEPITIWDEPRRLAFDVVAQPPPLRELSIYSKVYAPHLNGYFRSHRGEFRLIALPTGGTRLEGHTWYSVDVYPQSYWRAISEVVVHDIHRRVLDEVKREAESE